MKILHIGDMASTGFLFCRGLQELGIKTTLLSKKKSWHPSARQADWVISIENKFREFRLADINPDEYDLIHCHYLINLGSLRLSFTKTRTPVILHAHGCDTRPQNMLERLIQKRVLSLSNTLLFSTPDLSANITALSNEKIYLPNPVEIPEFQAGGSSREDRILIFTTLYKVKQTEKLFAMIQDMDQQFDIVDSGLDKEFLKKRMPANIRVIPPFAKEDVNRKLAQYPLILGGSMDGTIRVCELEAMALGIPTLFPFRYNDFYAQPLPMPDLTPETILKHAGDYDLGNQQREWVARHHEKNIVVQKLLDIYGQALKK